jgi:hypothetical protein
MIKEKEPQKSLYSNNQSFYTDDSTGNLKLIYDFYKSKYTSYSNKEQFMGYFASNTNLTQKYENRKPELILIEIQLFVISFLSLLLILNASFSSLSLANKKFNFIFLGIFLAFIVFLNYARSWILLIGFLIFLAIMIPIIIALFSYLFVELFKTNSLSLGEVMKNKIVSVDWKSIFITIIIQRIFDALINFLFNRN